MYVANSPTGKAPHMALHLGNRGLGCKVTLGFGKQSDLLF